MSEAFVGEIRICGFNFAPQGWAFCDGQLLSISQNTALFSILGTTYGGNGTTNFGLPDLRGSVPLGFGQGPGLSLYDLGQKAGEENVTLLSNQMPAHNHIPNSANNFDSDETTPAGNIWAASGNLDSLYASGNPNTTMNSNALGGAGGSQPHNNMQPTLTLNFVICMQGIFPQRS